VSTITLESRTAEVQEPMVPRPYVVARVHKDTVDTFTLEIHSLDGQGLVYAPGQFTMLYAFGVGEVPISISGDPSRTDPLVQTIRAVGPVRRAPPGTGPPARRTCSTCRPRRRRDRSRRRRCS